MEDRIISDIHRVLRLEATAILECADRLKSAAVANAFAQAVLKFEESLRQGGKIIVTGMGKSGKIAQKIGSTLCSTGSPAVFLHPSEAVHGDLGIISPKDILFALSYTGNTDEILRMLPSVKQLQVPIIGLGGNSNSKLAQEADVWIQGEVDQEACPHNLAPTTSTTLALAIGDALAISLMNLRDFHPEDFARNHPSGSLGKKLSLRVGDLMHRDNEVGCVGPRAGMQEVIVLATEKKLGAVLVTERKTLLGIITDGDIRRALGHQERFFGLCAEDIMTSQPITTTPDTLASNALKLMENRPSQISVLPVTDQHGNWVGLIRLHDLLGCF